MDKYTEISKGYESLFREITNNLQLYKFLIFQQELNIYLYFSCERKFTLLYPFSSVNENGLKMISS